MVCKDRATAEQVASRGDLDAITLEGDLVSRKGSISGGFTDKTRSKITAAKQVKGGGGRGASEWYGGGGASLLA